MLETGLGPKTWYLDIRVQKKFAEKLTLDFLIFFESRAPCLSDICRSWICVFCVFFARKTFVKKQQKFSAPNFGFFCVVSLSLVLFFSFYSFLFQCGWNFFFKLTKKKTSALQNNKTLKKNWFEEIAYFYFRKSPSEGLDSKLDVWRPWNLSFFLLLFALFFLHLWFFLLDNAKKQITKLFFVFFLLLIAISEANSMCVFVCPTTNT